ncbi:SsrA-binding protein SmpB [Microlunatus elymi]|uniref:SsrA-binding protein n=2 Tax=Microlunatus elymi TaxID=2596828 RepID=A0A516Q1V6_9ACTN|nr:SsrA-binding protein SmpB [Microlunatus elymi]
MAKSSKAIPTGAGEKPKNGKAAPGTKGGDKLMVAQNRRARHDYAIVDTFEAGVVLAGTEVKSLREGRASLADAFATVDDGEVWLRAAHIGEYSHGTWTNHAARRTRKLLLNRKEIAKIDRALGSAGTTLIPLAIYFSNGYAKVELAIATGKREFDKRESIAKRDAEREAQRALAARNKRGRG